MDLGRYIGWIALVALASCALFTHAAEPKRPPLPMCSNPDGAESRWRSLIANTHLVPDAPTSTPNNAQVKAVQIFLLSGGYQGWCHDYSPRTQNKRITGPYIGGKAYGTHSRVTVYYSKAMIAWLQQGRRGAIPDGAAIIKTMYATPAYVPKGAEQPIAGYAVMVRSAKASYDGWLWLLYYVPGNQSYRFEYLTSQYGASFCLSCHAQTSGDDMTFSDLSNLTGHDQATYVEIGDEVLASDATHPAAPPIPPPTAPLRDQRTLLGALIYRPLAAPLWHGDADMQGMLTSRVPALAAAPPPDLVHWRMPEDLIDDHAPPRPASAASQRKFATSDACVGCHDASDLLNNVPPHMTVDIGAAVPTPLGPRARYNLTPYGEWSASLMSRSSRDPVFRAQYEAELARVPSAARDTTAALCTRCHGPMGARETPALATDPTAFYATSDGVTSDPGQNRRAEYGALARDGVSCTVCHQISAKGLGARDTWSGKFNLEPVRGTINGPYASPLTRPMKKAIGMTPTYAGHIGDSGLCGACHVLEVPVYRRDDPKPVKKAFEQTTFLEWRNSVYSKPSAEAKTCVDCHMPTNTPPTFDANGAPTPGAAMSTQIANIEDASFPFVPNRASPDELQTQTRPNYHRHTLLGLNTVTHAMFQQFPLLLGAGSLNFGQALNLLPPSFLAARETLALADSTVKLDVSPVRPTATGIELTVNVINAAGHKFPSGVAFRRAWLEVKALDANGSVLWCSGCSDANGVIVDGANKWLPSEFATVAAELAPDAQRIDSEAQAQIYEARHEDCDHKLTDSFVRLCDVVKDNRLLPKGWSASDPDAEYTRPVASATGAPGTDTVVYAMNIGDPQRVAHVEVRMLYQSMPPYYLVERFQDLGPGADRAPEASRLYYLVTHLNIDDPALRSSRWRLEVACADTKAGTAPSTACSE